MDSRELTAWQAFYELEPWGDRRADVRAGVLASIHCRDTRPSDFFPDSLAEPPDERPLREKVKEFLHGHGR